MKGMIPLRTRIFIAGEGESEQSLIKWLQVLSNQQGLHVHLDCQPLGGGGYRTMLMGAIHARKSRDRTKAKVSILLVDGDRHIRGDDGWSLSQLRREAAAQKMIVCVQNPKLEAWLFRMLPGNERAQIDVTHLERQLRKAWPEYQKPADAAMLASKFSLNDLLRVAHAEPELKRLLTIIGLYA